MERYHETVSCFGTMFSGNVIGEKMPAHYAETVHATVQALSRLAHSDVRKRLQEFHRLAHDERAPVLLSHDSEILSNFESEFWPSCFVHLFPRGDCQERVEKGRDRGLPSFRWAKCLITRNDYLGWRNDVEFVSSLYNVLLRRDQLRAVYLAFEKRDFLSDADVESIAAITSHDFVSEVLVSGDCSTVREVLRRKNLDDKVRSAMDALEMCQRRVRGLEFEKSSTHFRFWHFVSGVGLFFTLLRALFA